MRIKMFEPKHEPAKTFYLAFEKEAENRKGKDPEDWILAERSAVYNAALDYATRKNLVPLTMEEIEKAEIYATGSADYGAKWAFKVVQALERKNQ
jgi:organic hydroperoxide reductase OsmC/OhrA